MSKFNEYLEQTSKVKTKEMINESYKVKTSEDHGDKIIYNGGELEEFELENITEFLNLLEKRNETISEWISFLNKNPDITLKLIEEFAKDEG